MNESAQAMIPHPGDFSVILDGGDHAACAVRATWVEQMAFSEVAPGFARDGARVTCPSSTGAVASGDKGSRDE